MPEPYVVLVVATVSSSKVMYVKVRGLAVSSAKEKPARHAARIEKAFILTHCLDLIWQRKWFGVHCGPRGLRGVMAVYKKKEKEVT